MVNTNVNTIGINGSFFFFFALLSYLVVISNGENSSNLTMFEGKKKKT